MANDILIKVGTRIVWADILGDFGDSPFAGTHELVLAALANTAARQGEKADFGEKRAKYWSVIGRFEMDVAAVAGKVIEVYFAASPHATPATANPGGTSGADAAYTGTAGDSLANSKKQLIWLGAHILTVDIATTVQQSQIAVFSPPERYGMPVVVNTSGQALEGDDIEMCLIFTPLTDEIQDAP